MASPAAHSAAIRRHRSLIAAPFVNASTSVANWQVDVDLSGVRDAKPLATLPTGERVGWEKFWADAKATLAEARKPASPPPTDSGKK
jgi:hypothetical protein